MNFHNIKQKIIFIFLGLSICFGLNLTLHDFDNPEASHILDTHVMDDILIVVGMIGGIEIYDISNPSILNHLAHFTLPNNGAGGGSKPNCVTTYGHYAYFTARNGVGIVNLENPSNPQYIGYIQNTNNMILENMDVYENILAVCAHTDGVLFFNLNNPENPSLIQTFETENAWAVELMYSEENNNSFAYVGSNSDLIILDFNNSELNFLYTMEFNHSVKDLVINDDILYVAFGSGGVSAFGLNGWLGGEPDSPIILDQFNTTGMANRLSVLGNKIAVSDWDDVEVLNWDWVSENLIKIGYKNTTRRTMAIAIKDNYIYSAEWATVQVMEYGEIDGPDIDLSAYEINYPFVENGDSNTMSIDITNNGNSLLEITDIFTTNNEFTISEFSNLLPDESQSIDVTYTAENINASGGLRIWSNDEDESDLTCEVNGNINGANIGEPAPDFELEIVANGSGNYRLSEHLGEIIVLAFFSPG